MTAPRAEASLEPSLIAPIAVATQVGGLARASAGGEERAEMHLDTTHEFLCTLQPRPNSDVEKWFATCREACRLQGYGLDATDLYPPHVTVTGFFTATQGQALEVCALAAAELAELLASRSISASERDSSCAGEQQAPACMDGR